MRVLLDPNILVSYLLLPRDPIHVVVDSALVGAYELVIPEALLDELAGAISEKDQLKTRVPVDQLAGWIDELKVISIEVPLLIQEIQPITGDLKDDYLLAYAVAGGADVLVSGSRDLLLLGSVGDLNSLSPEDLVRLLSWVPEA